MRVPFVKTAHFPSLFDLAAVADLLPRGQWVSVDGRKGRLIGTLDGVAWVHWHDVAGRTSSDFARSVRAFHNAVAMASRKPAKAPSLWTRFKAAWVAHFTPCKDETCGYSLHNAGRRA